MNIEPIVADYIGESPFEYISAKFMFRNVKEINTGMKCSNRLALTMNGVINRSLDDAKGLQSLDYSVYQIFEAEDLVFKLIDLENIKTSRVGFVHEKGIMSPAYIRITANNSDINTKFYYWYFYAIYINNVFNKLGGGIRQNLVASDLLKLPIPHLHRREQDLIADYLDIETKRVNELIVEKENFIKLLLEKRQALISHVVTKGLNPNVSMTDSKVLHLGKVPAHWTVRKIKYNVNKIGQGWSPQCESSPVSDSNKWGVVKVGCVNGGVFNPSQNKQLPDELQPRVEFSIKKNELLVSRANAKEWVGSAAVPKQDYPNLLLCDKIYRIKLKENESEPQFVSYFLATEGAREQIEIDATGTSSSMLNIGQGTILNLEIAQPDIHEQRDIVDFIELETNKIKCLVDEVKLSIELLKEHRTALISAAVTGKVDLREES